MPITFVNDTELQDLRGKGGVIVADFTADWCPPCRVLAPEIEKLSDTLADVTFVKVDVDSNPALTNELGIYSVPTVVHFDGRGAEVARSTGAVRAEELARRLRLDA